MTPVWNTRVDDVEHRVHHAPQAGACSIPALPGLNTGSDRTHVSSVGQVTGLPNATHEPTRVGAISHGQMGHTQ
jgi:hypothetical protein